jgi:hypothetical protein
VIDEDENSLTTLSLNDDPGPAAERAIQRAAEQKKRAPAATAFGGIGLVVFLALLFGAYSDYITHTREIAGLISRGRRIPAQLSGEPVQEGIRSSLAPSSWRVEYSYQVDGALEFSNLDGRGVMAYAAGAAACGLIFFMGGLTAWTNSRTG